MNWRASRRKRHDNDWGDHIIVRLLPRRSPSLRPAKPPDHFAELVVDEQQPQPNADRNDPPETLLVVALGLLLPGDLFLLLLALACRIGGELGCFLGPRRHRRVRSRFQ